MSNRRTNTHFLCKKHRKNLEENPEQALDVWSRLILSARRKGSDSEWEHAAVLYGNALEVAELIFVETPTDIEANRYIHTAIEFTFSLRQAQPDANLHLLVDMIEASITKATLTSHPKFTLKPLKEAAFSPIEKVSHWMNSIFNLSRAHIQSTH